MNKAINVFILISLFSWLCKHFLIVPIFNEDDKDISGFEFKVRF